jgi:NAD(P)-dependent dehydrogenase (short-subunit alcohol dehydrogenase family)
MSLQGKKVIITGASQGLGLAIAQAFAAEGADLLLGARGLDLLKAEAGRLEPSLKPGQQIICKALDVADEASAAAFVTEAQSRWASLDVLVNNAGIYGPKGAIDAVDWKDWVQALSVNLLGTVLMCRLALPLLKKSPDARILNLSGGGATAPLPWLSAYAASKAAVVRFSETLAEELKADGIGVNAIAPGALNTRMLDEILEAGPEKVGAAYYQKAQDQKAKGGASLSEAAALCSWLAGPEGKGISGRLISAVWDPWRKLGGLKSTLEGSDIYTLRRILPQDRGQEF